MPAHVGPVLLGAAGTGESIMAVISRLRDLGSRLVRLTGRGTGRARREASMRRLQAQIVKEQRELGRLVYPLIADGTLSADSPEIATTAERIRNLSAQLAAHRSPAQSSQIPQGMEHDAGWVEMLPVDRDQQVARGHLFLTLAAVPSAAIGVGLADRGQLVPVEGRWRGHVQSLRLAEGEALNAGERYRIRFELNSEVLLVDVTDLNAGDERGGTVSVVSADGSLPTMLLELGGE